MVQTYQPKPISFVPPILRRKFIAPDNPREMGTLVIIVALAVLLVSAWNWVDDRFAAAGAQAASGRLVSTSPYQSGNAQRMVGVYVFAGEAGQPFAVRSNRVRLRKADVPKQARIVWRSGLEHRARVIGEYRDYLLGIPVGLVIFGFGLWLRRKRPDAWQVAQGPSAPSSQ